MMKEVDVKSLQVNPFTLSHLPRSRRKPWGIWAVTLEEMGIKLKNPD